MLKDWRQRLRRSFSAFWGGRAELTTGGEGTFSLPNPDYLIRQLDIVEQATIQGEKGSPAQDSKGLDTNEGKVKAKLEAAASQSWTVYSERFELLERQLDALPFRRQWSGPKEMAEAFQLQVADAVRNAEDRLLRLFYEMCDAYTAFMAFRGQHRLMRDARLNDSSLSRRSAVFVLCFLVEWLFNGYYLGLRLEGGFVDGLITAASFAVANIGLGYLIGRLCLPHALHRRLLNIILGILGLLILSVCILALNLGVGHMRTLLGILEMDPLEAMAKAFMRVWKTPFEIDDMTSAVLVFVGVLCAIGAVWGGFRWDEYYPGYAQEARNFRNAMNALEQTRRFEFSRIARICEDFRKEIRTMRASIPSQKGDYHQLLAEMSELQRDHEAHRSDLRGVLNTVLRHYRDLNRTARRGVPAPAYFDEPVELTEREPQNLDRYKADEALLDKMIEEVEREAPDALTRASTEQENAQKRLADILPVHIDPSLACKEMAGRNRQTEAGGGGQDGDS